MKDSGNFGPSLQQVLGATLLLLFIFLPGWINPPY